MITFFKALPLSAVLAFVVANLLGKGGATGGMLDVFHPVIHGFSFYWSWPAMLAAQALAWALMTMME